MTRTVVCSLYRFTALDDPQRLRCGLLTVMRRHRVRGTVLLAGEGINGAIAGTRDGVDAVLSWLAGQPGLDRIEPRESLTDGNPFKRTRVKLKKEIVTMGVAGIHPGRPGQSGAHVKPRDWHALLDDDEALVVDVRNEYEVRIGAFDGAVNPRTANFREFPAFADTSLTPHKHRKIAMYCTGGIRCEKSAAYLKQLGFGQVFQLQGGILNYLAKIPEAESRWRGECFVFDDRVAVDRRLRKGSYDQCHACRAPICESDKRNGKYIPGAACPHCHDRVPAADRARFLERHKQVELAQRRGARHIGPEAMRPNAAAFPASESKRRRTK